MHADYEDLELPDVKELTPYNLYQYACYVIKGRWPEAEPHIMKDPKSTCFYARYVIRGRWPEAEPTIMQDSASACWYARDIIKDRWPEAEPIIMGNPYRWSDYCELFGISE